MTTARLGENEAAMVPKYEIPPIPRRATTQARYNKWLHGRAAAHRKRDKGRGNSSATIERYKQAIHSAVLRSDGHDRYTGERLDWSLIGTYNNELSAQGRRSYKATLALLPSVDHLNDGLGPASFEICTWRVNNAKADLTASAFIQLCEQVVKHTSGGKRRPSSKTNPPR